MKYFISAVVLALLSMSAIADTTKYDTKIRRITIVDGQYAGCMAEVEPTFELANCNSKFISFDCSGELGTTKSQSTAKLTAAQLGLVTGNLVLVQVTNTKSANGVCLATRVDNYNF